MTGSRLSAGIMTADLLHLDDELQVLRGTADWAHIDVMDGTFCPQLTVGPAFVKAVASTGVPVDAHIMVREPRRMLPELAAGGASVITVHVESTRHLHRTFQELTELSLQYGFVRGIALNPGTDLATLNPLLELVDLVLVLAIEPGWSGQSPAANTARRVAAVRRMAGAVDAAVLVGVDGGVTLDNASQVAGWGADVVVSGSAIYNGNDPAANLERMLHALHHPTLAA